MMLFCFSARAADDVPFKVRLEILSSETVFSFTPVNLCSSPSEVNILCMIMRT